MTYLLDLSPEQEARLQKLAAVRGAEPKVVALQLVVEGLRDVEAPTEAATPSVWPEMDELLSFAAALPDHRAAAGLGPVDLSGSRADVYCYSEREDAQR